MKIFMVYFALVASSIAWEQNWLRNFNSDRLDIDDRSVGLDWIGHRRRISDVRDNINRDVLQNVGKVDKTSEIFNEDLRDIIRNDKNLQLKQKFILDVFRSIYKTWTKDDSNRDVNRIVDGERNYLNFDKVKDIFRWIQIKDGFLPKGRVFTINNKLHRKQTECLFNLFFYSKDFEVFQKNVLWAVKNINEDMFVHALTVAILHRDDCLGVKLPALYEIVPYKFHSSMTIDKILKLRKDLNTKSLVVVNKNTNDYVSLNDEGKLAYFTEDIGLNLYHYYFHVDFPNWLGGKDLKLDNQRRGERYLNLIQQLLARYNLERLSNGLGNIKEISLMDRIKTGYNPLMRYSNGLPVASRKNYYDVRSTGDYNLINRVDDFERRIRDVIDKGYCTTIDGGKVDLKRMDAIDILGNLIQSNKDSVNNRFNGGLVRNLKTLLGGGHVKNVDDYKVLPSVLEHQETALRDPVMFQLYKKVMKLYYQFKDNLPVYKKEDLLLNGIRVENIKTTKLVTYFDTFDVDVTNIVNADDVGSRGTGNVDATFKRDSRDNLIVARHVRLNHKPFTISIDVTSEQGEKVVVRTFIGPKFDVNGKLIRVKDNRENFKELDKFVTNLQPGRITIKRDSRDFIYTVKDRSTINDIYKTVLLKNNVDKFIDMQVNEAHCRFPDRLVLPKGWVSGMPLQIFVVLTKAKDVVKRDSDHTTICGKQDLINDVDDKALGFPFDRRIDETEFYTTNMLFKDILIFHQSGDILSSNVDLGGKVVDLSGENINLNN